MVDWDFDPAAVDWMVDQLTNMWADRLTTLVPAGFPAYGRWLNPAYTEDGTRVRWAEVAAHNGVVLRPTSDFIHVALPERLPVAATAWKGSPPEPGIPERSLVESLVRLLEVHTPTDDSISFALSAGVNRRLIMCPGQPVTTAPDPIPPAVRLAGPPMKLPGREYFVCRGTVADVLPFISPAYTDIAPCFWWDRDHAWAVGTDGTVAWTIIGGSQDLIAELVQDSDLEVVAISEADVLDPVPPWLTALVAQAVQDLINHGQTVIPTIHGALAFRLRSDEHGIRLYDDQGGWSLLDPVRTDYSLEEQIFGYVESFLTDLNFV